MLLNERLKHPPAALKRTTYKELVSYFVLSTELYADFFLLSTLKLVQYPSSNRTE